MKGKAILMILILLVGVSLEATDGKVLEELLAPETMAMDETQLYITEGPTVHIYNRESLAHVAKFGKAGEGPREFRLVPGLPLILNVEGKELMVNSFGKVSYYSKAGKFLRENRTQAGFILMAFPFGKNLACWGLGFESQTRYRTIELYDNGLKKIRTVIKQKDQFQAPGLGMDILSAAFSYAVIGNRLFVAYSEDFVIHMFDLEGNPTGEIRKEMPRRKMMEADRNRILDFLKNDKSTREQFDILKPIRFPDQFPAIMAMFAAQDKLYVMTWKRENEQNEILILDAAGKLEKKIMLPVAYLTALRPAPFVIRDNQLYQLVENEEEDWELRITSIP